MSQPVTNENRGEFAQGNGAALQNNMGDHNVNWLKGEEPGNLLRALEASHARLRTLSYQPVIAELKIIADLEEQLAAERKIKVNNLSERIVALRTEIKTARAVQDKLDSGAAIGFLGGVTIMALGGPLGLLIGGGLLTSTVGASTTHRLLTSEQTTAQENAWRRRYEEIDSEMGDLQRQNGNNNWRSTSFNDWYHDVLFPPSNERDGDRGWY